MLKGQRLWLLPRNVFSASPSSPPSSPFILHFLCFLQLCWYFSKSIQPSLDDSYVLWFILCPADCQGFNSKDIGQLYANLLCLMSEVYSMLLFNDTYA